MNIGLKSKIANIQNGIDDKGKKYITTYQEIDFEKATPSFQQYLQQKYQYKEHLLFYRLGDFYELFFEDALRASEALDLTLTHRGQYEGRTIPMCGIPAISYETYVQKLVLNGFRIAVCEQVESAEEARKRGHKAIVNREVVRVITQGTITEDGLLPKAASYLVAISLVEKARGNLDAKANNPNSEAVIGIAVADISTGEFFIREANLKTLATELTKISPSELIITENLRSQNDAYQILSEYQNISISYPASFFDVKQAENKIMEFYEISSLASLPDLKEHHKAAIGGLLEYIMLTQKGAKPYLDFPKISGDAEFLQMDYATIRNLEIYKNIQGEASGSLFSVINKTKTASGRRLLKKYLSQPLCSKQKIETRQKILQFFYDNKHILKDLREILASFPDVERAFSRIFLERCTPRDFATIKLAFYLVSIIKEVFEEDYQIVSQNQSIEGIISGLGNHSRLYKTLNDALKPNLPNSLRDGGIIKPNFHPKLAEYQDLMNNADAKKQQLCNKYRVRYGLDGLRVKENGMIGIFFEVNSKFASKLSAISEFIHKQTLSNALRFTTIELGELSNKIINAKEYSIKLEKQLLEGIRKEILEEKEAIKQTADAIAHLDFFSSLADLALKNNYVRPKIREDGNMKITAGRHPVVEEFIKKNLSNRLGNQIPITEFTANDYILEESENKLEIEENYDFFTHKNFGEADLKQDNTNNQQESSYERLRLLTGPNMAGKSTFLRQNALIIIMAQIGSFVPAEYAEISLKDKIFCRVGSSDNLAKGESTFMVEMLETASILNNATAKSFVVIDEIGRGTATFDGLAIAQAVAENLHTNLKCTTLFATHYHELTKLEKKLKYLKCYTMQVKEINSKIIFTHKITKGYINKSYGIYVASLAGFPKKIISRATSILNKL